MFERFGPWSSALDDGPSTRLSTFWKRRMALLASARAARLGLSRRDWLKLGAAGTAACAWPTLHFAPADASGAGDDRPAVGGKIYAKVFLAPAKEAPAAVTGLFAIDPATGTFEKRRDVTDGDNVRLSPDGRMLSLIRYAMRPGIHRADDLGVWTMDAEGQGEMHCVSEFGAVASWSPDGRQLIVVKSLWKEPNDPMQFETWRYNADGTGATRLQIPGTEEVDDWSSDGKWLVTISNRHAPEGIGYQLYLIHPDGTGQRRLTEGRGLNVYPRFSPDGRKVAYLHQEGEAEIRVLDVDGGWRRVLREENDAAPDRCCWSPDGKWLACVIRQWRRDEQGRKVSGGPESRSWLVVVDADGKGRRKLDLPDAWWIGPPDWR